MLSFFEFVVLYFLLFTEWRGASPLLIGLQVLVFRSGDVLFRPPCITLVNLCLEQRWSIQFVTKSSSSLSFFSFFSGGVPSLVLGFNLPVLSQTHFFSQISENNVRLLPFCRSPYLLPNWSCGFLVAQPPTIARNLRVTSGSSCASRHFCLGTAPPLDQPILLFIHQGSFYTWQLLGCPG